LNTVFIERNNTRSSSFLHNYIRRPQKLAREENLSLLVPPSVPKATTVKVFAVPGMAVLPDEFFQPSLINAGESLPIESAQALFRLRDKLSSLVTLI
jgi:hypothetical protein